MLYRAAAIIPDSPCRDLCRIRRMEMELAALSLGVSRAD